MDLSSGCICVKRKGTNVLRTRFCSAHAGRQDRISQILLLDPITPTRSPWLDREMFHQRGKLQVPHKDDKLTTSRRISRALLWSHHAFSALPSTSTPSTTSSLFLHNSKLQKNGWEMQVRSSGVKWVNVGFRVNQGRRTFSFHVDQATSFTL